VRPIVYHVSCHLVGLLGVALMWVKHFAGFSLMQTCSVKEGTAAE
jgi:hypothetical protein